MNKVSFNWKSWWWSFHKHNYLILKLRVSILLVGLAFRFFFPLSSGFSEVLEIPFEQTISSSAPSPVSISLHGNFDQISPNGSKNLDSSSDSSKLNEEEKESQEEENAGKCNIFIGDWIPHPEGPVYSNETCDWIEGHQNCLKNGRPDKGYLFWRWKPRDCELPQLNPKRFLDLMRNKAWALIGDSISRNHVQSLFCILSKDLQDRVANAKDFSAEMINMRKEMVDFHGEMVLLENIQCSVQIHK